MKLGRHSERVARLVGQGFVDLEDEGRRTALSLWRLGAAYVNDSVFALGDPLGPHHRLRLLERALAKLTLTGHDV